jgi:hypothetical protein
MVSETQILEKIVLGIEEDTKASNLPITHVFYNKYCTITALKKQSEQISFSKESRDRVKVMFPRMISAHIYAEVAHNLVSCILSDWSDQKSEMKLGLALKEAKQELASLGVKF